MSGQNGQNGGEDDAGKLFVGGINRNTTDDAFQNYFAKFGDIKDCVLMRDKVTMQSRGFGFITYTDPMSLNEVLKERPHTLDNKVIDAKPCTPKHMQPAKKQYANQYPVTKKIFLGGISMEATEEDVKSYFSRYGVVVEVHFVSDRLDTQGRPHKGFGFITFEDESSVDQAIAKHYHVIKDKRCEAKSAEQKDRSNNQGAGNPYDQNQMGGYGQQMQQMGGYGQQQGNWMGANMMPGYGYGNGYGTYQTPYGGQQQYGAAAGANGNQAAYGAQAGQQQQAYGGYGAGYGYGNMYGQQAVPGGAPGMQGGQQGYGSQPTSTATSAPGGYQNPGKGYHPYKR